MASNSAASVTKGRASSAKPVNDQPPTYGRGALGILAILGKELTGQTDACKLRTSNSPSRATFMASAAAWAAASVVK